MTGQLQTQSNTHEKQLEAGRFLQQLCLCPQALDHYLAIMGCFPGFNDIDAISRAIRKAGIVMSWSKKGWILR